MAEDLINLDIKPQHKTSFKSFVTDTAQQVHQGFIDKIATLKISAIESVQDGSIKNTVLQQIPNEIGEKFAEGQSIVEQLKTDVSAESSYGSKAQQVGKTLTNVYSQQLTEHADPPAAATAAAANVRHQNRVLRLAEQKLLRTDLRMQFDGVYKIHTDMIAEMKIKLQAEKLL